MGFFAYFRDLKPENILLSEDMHIQITDFGTAKQLSSDSKQGLYLWAFLLVACTHGASGRSAHSCLPACVAARANSFVGTAQYVSPELLTEKSACKRCSPLALCVHVLPFYVWKMRLERQLELDACFLFSAPIFGPWAVLSISWWLVYHHLGRGKYWEDVYQGQEGQRALTLVATITVFWAAFLKSPLPQKRVPDLPENHQTGVRVPREVLSQSQGSGHAAAGGSERWLRARLLAGFYSLVSLITFQSQDPSKRIGCEEMGGYPPLKQHPFFDTISWSDLHLQTPPKLTPYLPAMSEDDEDCYGNVSCCRLPRFLRCPAPVGADSAPLSQYDDLLSQFSNMQVAQSSSSHSLSPHESMAPQRSSSNIEQYIHDLDNNSFELDLQFTEEEKQLLLDKQTTGNPWYSRQALQKCSRARHSRVSNMSSLVSTGTSSWRTTWSWRWAQWTNEKYVCVAPSAVSRLWRPRCCELLSSDRPFSFRVCLPGGDSCSSPRVRTSTTWIPSTKSWKGRSPGRPSCVPRPRISKPSSCTR